MRIPAFTLSPLPQVIFGDGVLMQVPLLAAQFGRRALVVTGARAFTASPYWQPFNDAMRAQGIAWTPIRIDREPSPTLIDARVADCRAAGGTFDVVIGIGGGSVLDAAKAIAGLLPSGASVMEYLEGVGRGQVYNGPSVPYIAVPTTAGTGSEATKNAVLSEIGPQGYKKSFRDNQLIPRYAVLDPLLLASAPQAQLAANGMDAFTQLLEAFVSSRAYPLIDALAFHAMEVFAASFFAAWEGGNSDGARAGRGGLAYASLLSGIALAQVGLGVVHGIASPLGAFFPIPHGVACGTLLATATAANIHALQQRAPTHPALHKYARVGRLLSTDPALDDAAARTELCEILVQWQQRTAMPPLSAFGVGASDVARIVANSRGNSMKTNPVELTDDEVAAIVRARLD